MKLKKILKWSFAIMGLIMLGFFTVVVFFPHLDLPGYLSYTKVVTPISIKIPEQILAEKPEKITSGLPVRLKIPKMNVDTSIDYVSVTPDGAMDVPDGPDNVAWFQLGPRPGDMGSAVIAGHYGWKNNIPAVFDNLNQLRKGDKVYVTDENGTIMTFVVRELQLFKEHDDASAVFISNDGMSHLNFITCEGVWNKIVKSYPKRLVVFTDREI